MELSRFIELIKKMPPRNRAVILAAIVLGMTGLLLLLSWSGRPDYRILYSNLAESDAGPIAQKLKDMKVPYKVEAGGILVPEDRVYDIRLQLAAQGLPRGAGVGFELFDKTDFGTTDFVQRLNYTRALQGELARTILALSEVEQCRVHLALPEKSLFVEGDGKPSASVLLKLRPGRVLSEGQVQGIVHLVSSSIEDLNPKDITIVDSSGNMLTRSGDGAGLSDTQLEYQRNYEKDLESRIMGILDPIVGKDKVRARVTANIDFTKSEKTEEKFDPDGQVVRSEQRNMEKSASGGQGGVPGVSSNLPGKDVRTTSGTQVQSQKQNDTVNYEISKVTSHVVNPSGEIKRLSVAVIVDGVLQRGATAKDAKYVPRSAEDLARYEDLVKKAVGFSADRGDEVKVVNMQFEGIPKEEFAEAPRQYMKYISPAAKYIIPLVGFMLFFLFIIRPLMKTLSVDTMGGGQMRDLPLPRTVAEIERAIGGGGAQAALPVQEDVVEWAKKNPEKAANLVKRWIAEK